MHNETRSRKYDLKGIQLILIFVVFAMLTACGSGRNTESRIDSYNELQELVDTRRFEIENDWAMPLRGSMVNLVGNPNYIRFKGDSVDIYLPYFGVRQFGGAYSQSHGGIDLKGIAKDLEIVENPERQNIVVKFRGEQGNEDLQFFITLFPNGRANTNVNTSQRDAIQYQGHIERIGDDDEN